MCTPGPSCILKVLLEKNSGYFNRSFFSPMVKLMVKLCLLEFSDFIRVLFFFDGESIMQ